MAGRAARHKDINFCKANKENSRILLYVINNLLVTCGSTDPWKRWGILDSLSRTHVVQHTHVHVRTWYIYTPHSHYTHTQAVVRVYPLTMTLFFSTRALLNSTPRIHQDRQFRFCFLVFVFLFFHSMYNVSMSVNIRVCIFMNVAYIWACYLYACVYVSYTSYSCSSH